ncbi:hypothetical protein [Helicobacter salomonis]|uniref:hypothetical protein n=1 Tax=Helicobacter salomonis TaxID=56878 RepID=UPI000CF08047|nr:hypothetical protein [Helicobacter salomonis]
MDVVYAKKYEDVLNLAAGLNGQNKLEVHRLAAMLVDAEHDYCQRLQTKPQAKELEEEWELEVKTLKILIYTLRSKLGFDCPMLGQR